jgi:hypothetical protein
MIDTGPRHLCSACWTRPLHPARCACISVPPPRGRFSLRIASHHVAAITGRCANSHIYSCTSPHPHSNKLRMRNTPVVSILLYFGELAFPVQPECDCGASCCSSRHSLRHEQANVGKLLPRHVNVSRHAEIVGPCGRVIGSVDMTSIAMWSGTCRCRDGATVVCCSEMARKMPLWSKRCRVLGQWLRRLCSGRWE